MPVEPREVISALTALFGGVLAAFVLTNPPGGGWAVYTSDRELSRWISSQPTGVAVGAVVAVLAYALLQRRGSRRIAWIAMAGAAAVILGMRLAVPGVGGIDALIAVHYVKTVAAGVILGAAVATVWGRRAGQLALTLGVLATFLTAHAFELVFPAQTTSTIGEPSWWLLGPMLVLAVVAAAVADGSTGIQRATGRELRLAITTAASIALANRALLYWIDRQDYTSRVSSWIVIGLSMVLVLVLTWFAARTIDSTGGRFLLAATGVAAASMPVLVDIGGPFPGIEHWQAVLVGAVAVAIGLRVAMTWRSTIGGLFVVALIPMVGAIWPNLGQDGSMLLVRLAVLGVGAGLAFGSSLPGTAAFAAVGLGIPFVSMVFHSAATVFTGVVAYGGSFDGAYAPLTSASQRGPYEAMLGIRREPTFTGGSFADIFDIPAYDDRVAGIALLIAVLACAVGVRALARPTATPEPDSA
ncbi:hypothetical protein FCG67_07095 [Rhodococcus oryzae]|uniref:Uncharacterized protein n=1 Tax=Rhodococcus oryzae TaxID=2571143 RepID=A0ABY2RM73_9NOCA|nr:hypothetical protein [Rhodococcus oryzae]TJZ79396.1 hypothetical protein FCG67_07095 [Rhodococcus oryzae]